MPLVPAIPHISTGQMVTAGWLSDVADGVNNRLQTSDLIALTAFGTHTLIAGGAGAQGLQIKNTSSGTGSYAISEVINDTGKVLDMMMLSSTYVSGGTPQYFLSGGGVIRSNGTGGLTLASLDATNGFIRFYTGENLDIERMRLHREGQLVLTAVSPFAGSSFLSSSGLVINQGTNPNEIACFKAADIAHGMTSIADTDTYGTFSKSVATDGGLRIRGLSETVNGIDLKGNGTTEDTASTTAANGAVTVDAAKKSGTTLTSYGATANLFVVRNNGAAQWFVKGNGDQWHNGTDNTFSTEQDVELALAWERAMSPTDRVNELFRRFCSEGSNTERLIELGILSEKDPATGRHAYNSTALLRLCTGAIWQLGMQVQELKQRLETDRA